MTTDHPDQPFVDQDFERQLRQRLHQAAGAAPRFSEATARSRMRQPAGAQRRSVRRRRTRPIALVAAVLVLIAVAGGIWTASRGGSITGIGGGAAGSCAPVLFRNGSMYEPYPTVRVPHQGAALGKAYWCKDTNDGPRSSDTVYALAGVPSQQGFLFGGQVWLRTDLTRTPPAVEKLQEPVTCTRSTKLSGRIEEFNGRSAGNPVRLHAPYTMGVRVQDGLRRIGMQRYDNVQVTVRVTERTHGRAAISKLAQHVEDTDPTARVVIRCRGDAFVATSVRLS